MTRARGRLRAAGATLALAASSAIVTLGAAELTLRIFHPQTLLHDPDAFVTDPVLGGRLKPGFSDAFTSPEYTTRWEINAAGHRGPAAGPGGGAFRIAAVGDSFTFGYGVEEEEAWPRALEADLRERTAEALEVVNLGVGGYGAVQEVLWLRENLERGLAPDLVVLAFYPGNDLSDSIRGDAARRLAARGGAVTAAALPAPGTRSERVKRYLGSHWHLYSLVSDRADGLLVRLGLRNVVYPEEVDVLRSEEPEAVRDGWNAVAGALADLRRLALDHRFRTLVVGIPMRHQVVPASWERVRGFHQRLTGEPLAGVDLDHPRARLRALCEAAGVDLLDLTGPFRADPDPSRLYFRRDQHWSRAGHALAARIVGTWTLTRLSPGRPEGPDGGAGRGSRAISGPPRLRDTGF